MFFELLIIWWDPIQAENAQYKLREWCQKELIELVSINQTNNECQDIRNNRSWKDTIPWSTRWPQAQIFQQQVSNFFSPISWSINKPTNKIHYNKEVFEKLVVEIDQCAYTLSIVWEPSERYLSLEYKWKSRIIEKCIPQLWWTNKVLYNSIRLLWAKNTLLEEWVTCDWINSLELVWNNLVLTWSYLDAKKKIETYETILSLDLFKMILDPTILVNAWNETVCTIELNESTKRLIKQTLQQTSTSETLEIDEKKLDKIWAVQIIFRQHNP